MPLWIDLMVSEGAKDSRYLGIREWARLRWGKLFGIGGKDNLVHTCFCAVDSVLIEVVISAGDEFKDLLEFGAAVAQTIVIQVVVAVPCHPVSLQRRVKVCV